MIFSIMKDLEVRSKRLSAFKAPTIRDVQARTAHIKDHLADKPLGQRDFRTLHPRAKLVGVIT